MQFRPVEFGLQVNVDGASPRTLAQFRRPPSPVSLPASYGMPLLDVTA